MSVFHFSFISPCATGLMLTDGSGCGFNWPSVVIDSEMAIEQWDKVNWEMKRECRHPHNTTGTLGFHSILSMQIAAARSCVCVSRSTISAVSAWLYLPFVLIVFSVFFLPHVTMANKWLIDWLVIRKRNFQLFGRICRMPDSRLLKTLLFGTVEGDTCRKTTARTDWWHTEV